jgi:hypothetical protein
MKAMEMKDAERLDHKVQAWVDYQLQESGAYSPLELLLQSGRLDYNDYDAWRRREIETIDPVLRGNLKKIKSQLQAADRYARHIKLIAEEEDFPGWQQGAQSLTPAVSLRVSVDKELRQLLSLRFVHIASGPQLDMFFNNPVVTIVNALQVSLLNGNLAQAQGNLDKLYQYDPNHRELGAYDKLLDMLRHSVDPVSHPQREFNELVDTTPIAKRLLGLQARNFLVPLWQRLAEGLNDHSFDPQNPQLHQSYAAYQAQDFSLAINAIEALPQWRQSVELMVLLAECAYRRKDLKRSVQAWCLLCWRFPEAAEKALGDTSLIDEFINYRWQLFLDYEVDGNEKAAQTALRAEDFPAWLLLYEPGLVKQLDLPLERDDSPGEKVFRITYQLLRSRFDGDADEEMRYREVLKNVSPLLFDFMLKKIALL